MSNKFRYLLTLNIICNGERYKFLKYFSVYEDACAELEKYENMFYFLVVDYNWDCSEDREDCQPDEPLYWFNLYPSSMPVEDRDKFSVEGNITDTYDETNWIINYLD